jgi:hypothetical protein
VAATKPIAAQKMKPEIGVIEDVEDSGNLQQAKGNSLLLFNAWGKSFPTLCVPAPWCLALFHPRNAGTRPRSRFRLMEFLPRGLKRFSSPPPPES